MNNNLEIAKMLTLSTAHISEHTAKCLDNKEEQLSIIYYPKSEYGWFINLDSDYFEEIKGSIPGDLLKVMEFAIKNDCLWLCLDCDGDVIEELPTFKW